MSRINISPEIRAMAAKAMAEIEPQFKKIDEIAEINTEKVLAAFRENRVSDHRIGLTVYTLDAYVNGDIDGVIDALATADTAEKLKGSSDQ